VRENATDEAHAIVPTSGNVVALDAAAHNGFNGPAAGARARNGASREIAL
jgi:hypothetical protein